MQINDHLSVENGIIVSHLYILLVLNSIIEMKYERLPVVFG